ncbi:MAG: DUF1768 domain-containing protein [Clostridia bacterium]|nr:DUF1768 domain-containing protein [Clostridia bacterium]
MTCCDKKENIVRCFRSKYSFLSNFYSATVFFDGVTYLNSESAYQAQKCKNEEERLLFTKLSSDEAKSLGKKVDCREDWDEVKLSLMKDIVYNKFTQNPHLAKALTDTGEIPLFEGNNWGDLYWGVDLKTGVGENNLGKILMNLRKSFAEKGIPKTKNVPESLFEHSGDVYVVLGDTVLSECEYIVCDISQAETLCVPDECRKRVIFAEGPRYPAENCAEKLFDCYTHYLDNTKENDIHSIAFSVISVGKYSYPKKEACRIAVEAVKAWKVKNPQYNLIIKLFSPDSRLYGLLCEELKNEKT